MSTQTPFQVHEIDYPTGDGQPVAETPIHRDNLFETIWTLKHWYGDQGRHDVYISGNMFVYYEKGNRRRHLSPDVFVVFGVPDAQRECYKTWEEAKPTLDLVIEFTSRSTKEEDLEDKFELYRDELGVREYLLFDPYSEYLEPPQRLFRLKAGEYETVGPMDGRLPSEVLGLHFERQENLLRLWIPDCGVWIPTSNEDHEEIRDVREENREVREEIREAREEIREVRDENRRLRDELEAVKRRIAGFDANGGERS